MRRLVSVLLPSAALVAAACSSAPAAPRFTPSPSADPGRATPTASRETTTFRTWPMFHGNAARTGHVATAPGTPLHRVWRTKLGQVYGEPLIVGSTLIAATESDKVFGLDARTGQIRWKTSVGTPQPLSGLPCGDISPEGITSTPAYDAATGSVFVVAETLGGHHTLWALNAKNGHKRWHRSLDTQPSRNIKAEQQRSALLIAGGRVIASFGGLSGDCDNYVGYITSTPVTGSGATTQYAVPTARAAGMWSTAGPIRGAQGHVYVASGNGAELNGVWDQSDSLTELAPGSMNVLSIFAPSTWRQDNQNDKDLGSASPAWVPSIHRMVIAGKSGTVYLLPEHFGGIGSEIAKLNGCGAFSGPAVVGRTVLMPCLFQHEIRALNVGTSSLSWKWTAKISGFGSPVVAGSRVYVANTGYGELRVLRLKDGHTIQRIRVGRLTHFPSEVVDAGYVFVPTLYGVIAFHG